MVQLIHQNFSILFHRNQNIHQWRRTLRACRNNHNLPKLFNELKWNVLLINYESYWHFPWEQTSLSLPGIDDPFCGVLKNPLFCSKSWYCNFPNRANMKYIIYYIWRPPEIECTHTVWVILNSQCKEATDISFLFLFEMWFER